MTTSQVVFWTSQVDVEQSFASQDVVLNFTGVHGIVLQYLNNSGGPFYFDADVFGAISVGGADTTAPTLTSAVPADGAASVAKNADIVLTFDEDVKAGTGNITLTNDANPTDQKVISVTDAQVTISGKTVTIDPSADLTAGAHYHVTVDAGAIEDLAGNDFAGISTTTELDFTVASPPPVLVSAVPTDGASSVAKNADVVLTFDKDVQAGTGNITLTNDANPTDQKVISVTDAQVTISGKTVTIDPSADLTAGAHYHVTVDAGAIEDLAGNDFAGISTATELDFTVASPPSPTPQPPVSIPGNSGQDVLSGNSLGNVMDAGDSDDSVSGGAGDDSITGGSGNDSIGGGDDNDVIAGGSGNDTISGDAGNDAIAGGLGDDSLAGNQGMDSLFGAAGSDTIVSGDDDDLAFGGQDNDEIWGGEGADTVVAGSGDDAMGGGGGSDQIAAGAGDDTVFTGGGDDTVFAGSGTDAIFGGSGNDVIYLGTPDGVADVYHASASNGSDVVFGFEHGVDKLDLSASGVASFTDLTIGEDADGNAVISLGQGGSLTLYGVSENAVDSGDFVF
ncbi:Ig-like domain-containing protein [Aurantimonas sp. VKM B-3413]|uniref:Ig-like domain-containing protein n=1 Tax=Aurantimonas sp. VKM B-3413 TaxID=2779401 RepID=UPI00351D77C2|nr:Ig-like domain-containing protein [Aurantimonas sp. VKM B-3413]